MIDVWDFDWIYQGDPLCRLLVGFLTAWQQPVFGVNSELDDDVGAMRGLFGHGLFCL